MDSGRCTHRGLTRIALLGMALGALGGCRADLSLDVDDEVQVECRDNGDCPSGSVCKTALGLCMPIGGEDDVAPEVLQKSVTPAVAGSGAVVRAEFVTDEPLHLEPTVVFPALDGAAFLLAGREKTADGGERYVFDYPVRGTETEGHLEVAARGLVDRWGNENPSEPLGEVEIDFTGPPAPVVSVVEATADGRVNTTTVTLALDNHAMAAEVLVSGSGRSGPADWQPVAAELTIELAAETGGGKGPAPVPGDGPRALLVRYRDTARNEGEETDLTLDLDRTPPDLLDLDITVESGFSAARDGSTLTVGGFTELGAEVVSLETVFQTAAGDVPGALLDSGWAVDGSGQFAIELTLQDIPEGAESVCAELVLSDGLNPGAATGCERLVVPVDNVAPESPLLNVVEGALSNGHDPSRPWVTLQLGVTNTGREGDLSDIEVYLSGEGLAGTDEHANAWLPYPAEGTVAVYLSAGDGDKPLTGKYRDGAGNETASTATASTTLDTAPPTGFDITGPAEVSQPAISATVLGEGGSELFISGDVAESAQTFQWIPWAASLVAVPLDDAAEQAYTLRAQGRDAAGNLTEVKTLTTTLTGAAATFSLPVLTPPDGQSAVKTGDVLAAGGSACTECTLAAAWLVVLDAGGAELERQDVAADLAGTWGEAAVTFSGDLTLGTLPAETAGLLLEVIVERGGEQSLPAVSRSAALPVDNVPPADGRVEAAVEVTSERTVTLYFIVTNTGREDDLGDVELRLEGDRIDATSGGDGRPITELPRDAWLPYTAEATVLLTDAEDTGSISVRYRDGAHNEISGTATAVRYDATAPANPAVAISPQPKTASTTVDLTLSAVDADEMHLSGDLAAGASVGTWIDYAPTLQVDLTPGDGPKTVLVRYRDDAHNETDTVLATVELDSTAPTGSLTLSLTEARTAAASNSVLTVSGATSGDATLTDLALVYQRSNGQETGRAAAAGVTLTDGVFTGTVNTGTIPAETARLELEATLDDGASTAVATSNTIPVDDTAPASLTVAFATETTNQGSATATIGVDNPGQSGTGDLEMLFDGAGLANDDPLKGNWVPFVTSGTLTLSAGDGTKTVTVTVRDGAHNEVGPETATITVDTSGPTSPRITIQGPDETASTTLTVELSCTGATEVYVSGDEVVNQGGVTFEWIALPPTGELEIQVTADNGTKTVTAQYRDDAQNTSDSVSDAVYFNSDEPVSSPLLIAPDTQTRVKWNDDLDIGGTAWTGADIEAARLVFRDGTGAEVGERALAAGTEIILDDGTGVFSGGVPLLQAETPGTAVDVLVEAVIKRQGGTCPDDCSVAADSRSAALPIDRDAPTSGTLDIQESLDVKTRNVTAVFGIDNVGEAGYGDIELRLSGSGVDATTPHRDEWIAYQATLDVVLTTGEGDKIVEVTYRDGAHHLEGPAQVTVDYDISAPTGLSLVLAGGAPKTASLTVSAAPGATDVFEMYITGDVDGPAAKIDQWVAHEDPLDLDLVDAEGTHIVQVTYRDRAHNEAGPVSDTIDVDRDDPEVTVAIAAPDGQTAVKANDVLDVSGQSEAGATIDSARVLDQTLSPIPGATTNLTLDPDTGALTGTVTLPGAGNLAGVTTATLEVVVSDGLNLSVAADSRSNAVTVDIAAPTIDSLQVVEGAVVNSVTVTVRSTATDAAEMRITGLLQAGAYSDWFPYAADVAVQLTDVQGDHGITVEIRDGAHNTDTDASLTVKLDTVVPTVAPTVSAPAGQTAVKDGDLLTFGGSGGVGEDTPTVASARLIDEDDQTIGALTVGVDLIYNPTNGAISGSANLPATGAALVRLEVIITDGANDSEANLSRSAALTVDNDPPDEPVVTIDEGGSVGDNNVHISTVAASDVDWMTISGDVSDGGRRAFNDTAEAVTLTTVPEGNKTVCVVVEDGAANTSGQGCASTNYKSGAVDSDPELTLPGVQTKVKTGDILLVGGKVNNEAGATIDSARILDADTAATIQDCTADVSIDAGGNYSGSVTLADLTGHARLQLEVIAAARALTSTPADSRTTAVDVDLVAPNPAGITISIGNGNPHQQDADNRLDVTVTGADVDWLRIVGDLAGSYDWTAFTSPHNISNLELTAGDGPKALTFQFRDGAANEGSKGAGVTIDNDPPDPVSLTLLSDSPTGAGPAVVGLDATEPHGSAIQFRLYDGQGTGGYPNCATIGNQIGEVDWKAFTAQQAVALAGTTGNKRTYVQYRDQANNTTGACDHFVDVALDEDEPTIAGLVLNPPAGQTRVKDGDVLTVGGTTEVGADLVSATLTGSGALDTDVSGSVKVEADGSLSGNIPLGTWAGTDVRIEVIVADSVGNPSNNTVSASLDVDNAAPAINSVNVVQDPNSAPPWCSGVRGIDLVLTADEPGCAFRVSGDVDTASGWVASPVSVTLKTGDDTKSLNLQTRDGAGNTGEAVLTVKLDTATPSATDGPEIELADSQTRISNTTNYGIDGRLNEPNLTLVSAELGYWQGAAFVTIEDISGKVETSGLDLRHTSLIAAPVGLVHDEDVRARFVVDDCANTATLLTPLVRVDNVAPSISTVRLYGSGGVAGYTDSRFVEVEVEATGAPTQVRFTGTGLDDTAWADYDFGTPQRVGIEVHEGDGPKEIDVEIRDAGHNTDTDTTNSITLDTTTPNPNITIALDSAGLGKTHVRDNDDDRIWVSGSGEEANLSIAYAHVMGHDGGGGYTMLLDVTGMVAIDGGNGDLDGFFDLAAVGNVSDYVGIVLEVVVEDVVGNWSADFMSRSNEIPTDGIVPQNVDLDLAAVQDDPTNNVFITVDAASDDAISVCFYGVNLDVGALHCDDSANFVPLTGSPMPAVVELDGTNGDIDIWVRFRDQAFNEDDASTSVHFDDILPEWTGSPAFRTDPGDETSNLDGTIFAWNDDGTVTIEFESSEYPVTLALVGLSGIDNTWIATPGNCDRWVINPIGIGRICYLDYDQADCAPDCTATFELNHSATNGGQPCEAAAHAPGDGLKIFELMLEDPAENESSTTVLRAMLDRTCPTQMVLQPTTVPQYTEVDGTNYVTDDDLVLYVQTPSTDTDFTDYEWRVNGVDPDPWTATGANNTSFTFGAAEGMQEGANVIEIRGRDLEQDPNTPITTFNVTVDTVDPSQPTIAPSNVTFNGVQMPVFITQKSVDPGGAADGSDLSYQYVGGAATEWTDVAIVEAALTDGLDVVYPFFEVAGLPQQQGLSVLLRSRDNAGNTSPAAVLSVTEASTHVLETSTEVIGSTDIAWSLGLWADHLAWSEVGTRNLYHTDIGGTTDLIWTSTGIGYRQEEIRAYRNFVLWLGIDDANDAHIYMYDLGPDEMNDTGDEDPFPVSEVAVVDVVDCSGSDNSAFDFDGENQELAYTIGDPGCTSADDLYVMDTSGYPALAHPGDSVKLCDGCVTTGTVTSQVAIDDGCVIWVDDNDEVRKRCKGANNVWDALATGDDVEEVLHNGSGDCTFPPFTGRGRGLGLGYIDGEQVAVWHEREPIPPYEFGLCLWRADAAGPDKATSIAVGGGTHRFPDVALAPDSVVYFKRDNITTVSEAYRYTVATAQTDPLAIPIGRIHRLAAWGDRMALTRKLEGDDQLELFEVSNERQVSLGDTDHLDPDVDGDRMVYIDYRHHRCGEVYLYDLNLNAVTRLTTNSSCPATGAVDYRMCPQISGEHVIWVEVNATLQPSFCEDRSDIELYGLDLADGPPYDAGDIRHISVGLAGAGFYSPRISGDNVIYGSRVAAPLDYKIHHYDWNTQISAPLTPIMAGHADIEGNSVVYVDWETADVWALYRCDLTDGCTTPEMVVPSANENCAGGGIFCSRKYQPRLRGDNLVWLDNREVWDGGASDVEYHVYWLDLTAPLPASGTRLTSTPWSGVSGGGQYDVVAPNMVEKGGTQSPDRYWDSAGLELGDDFVVFNSMRKAEEHGSTTRKLYREVVRIDLAPFEPGVYPEITLTHSDAFQGGASADASGNVVWSDIRDGTFYQIFWYNK